MLIGLISGSGTDRWPGSEGGQEEVRRTRYGAVEVTRTHLAGTAVVHLSRHGRGHQRLSNQVEHRANLTALLESGVDALISVTACGAVDPTVPLGAVVVFDDLYFPSNRLPDGSLCTWHDVPGAAGRGHWIFDRPFSEPLRQALVSAGHGLETAVVPAGCYGHVDGPRFNTRAEIAALAAAGVTAVSQTAGPEVVLAGEAQLPFALVGFVTDHANGVVSEPQPVADLLARVGQSTKVLASLVERALPGVVAADLGPAGVVHRFDP